MSTLPHHFFKPQFKHHTNFGLSIENFEDLLEEKYNKLDLNVWLPKYEMHLQRPFVWDQLKQEQFILSLLKENGLPPFIAVQHDAKEQPLLGPKVYRVIDGKQRINTIFRFIKNEFSVSFKGRQIFYDDIHPWDKSLINDPPQCKWNIHYSYKDMPISDDTMIEIFERVNFMGVPQDINHMQALRVAQQSLKCLIDS